MTDERKGLHFLIASIVGGMLFLVLVAVLCSICRAQSLPQSPVVYDSAGTLRLNVQAIDLNLRTIERWLQYYRANVFCAIDSAGSQVIPASDTVAVTLDKQIITDNGYKHTLGTAAVAVTKDGTYEISYAVSMEDAPVSISIFAFLYKFHDAWEVVDGTTITYQWGNSGSTTVPVTLDAGDSVAVYVGNPRLSAANTKANGTSLYMRFLH